MVMEHGGGWGWQKIGPGPVPIEVDEGWLMIFHGVRDTASGFIYCAGGAILDREQPWKVLHRCVHYLLAPTEDYERIGDVFNVVFPTSLVHDEATGKLDLYYGCADTRIGVAHANIREVVDYIIANRVNDPSF
jgi:beta-1,4-mannooligosaccharide/beta-1,4-mannosyl-N-acetylglucosamine phosphorylase